MAKSISGKKNKKVFREGVIQIHGRFKLNGDDEPVLITEGGASRGVKSVELVDPEVYRVTLNMPKATFLGAPVVTYINDASATGSIYRFPVTNIVSTPVPNPNHELASFDIVSTNYANAIAPFPNDGDGICSFTLWVTTSVVPNGMNPSVVQSPQTWREDISYVDGDVVTFEEYYYVAKGATTNNPPWYSTASWEKYTLNGAAAWSATTTYVGATTELPADKVLSGGIYYRALDVVGNLNKQPGVAVDWADFWTILPVIDNPYVARTAIGGTTIVHTPKLETFSVYGRMKAEPQTWVNDFNYSEGGTCKYDGKYWVTIVSGGNTGNEPSLTSTYWEQFFLVDSDDAKSEGIESIVRAGFSGLYPLLPENAYVVTLKTTSPIVQFLGAAAITPFQYTTSVAALSVHYDAKVFCEGASATYGTSANQIVLAFYDQLAVPQLIDVSDIYADEILLTFHYTTSRGF